MSNFKKGDEIRIKDGVSSETHRGVFPHFMEEMNELKDKVLTIRDFTGMGGIKVEESVYNLLLEWVEPLNNFKNGDKIRIKDEVSSETHSEVYPHFTRSMDGLKDKVLTFSQYTPRGIKIKEYPWELHPDWVTLVEDDSGSAVAEISRLLSEKLSYFDSNSILEEAEEILGGDRDSDYGDPVANFNRISRIASSILDEDISPEQCVVVMMAVKLSREQYKHKRDNLVDLVAYTEIYNRIKEH